MANERTKIKNPSSVIFINIQETSLRTCCSQLLFLFPSFIFEAAKEKESTSCLAKMSFDYYLEDENVNKNIFSLSINT